MIKFVVKKTDLYEITAKTSLKVGDGVIVNLPKGPSGATYTTVISAIKGNMKTGNKISVKTPLYSGWMDIHYVLKLIK